MPAVTKLKRITGDVGAPTLTDITSSTSRLSLSDSATPGTDNPVLIPNAGTNYSFWAIFALYADTAPAGTIDTIKLYSDGSNSFGTGVGMKVAQGTTYIQATGSATTGLPLTVANYLTLTGEPVDIFTYTSGAALAVAGSIANPNTGRVSNYLAVQASLSSAVVPGIVPAETITVTYKET